MQRREAVEIFEEICQSVPETSVFRSVGIFTRSNDEGPTEEDFELRIKGELSQRDLNFIKSIVKRFQKAIEIKRETLIIYAPKQESVEITA